jgi:hypothetical protein
VNFGPLETGETNLPHHPWHKSQQQQGEGKQYVYTHHPTRIFFIVVNLSTAKKKIYI